MSDRSSTARPSRTAEGVLRALSMAEDLPRSRGIAHPEAVEAARRLVAALHERDPARTLVGRARRILARIFEAWVLPDGVLHLALRKRFVEEEARRALREGCGTVVVLGAGLCVLGPRLAREDAATVIEVDREATLARRRTALERLGGLPDRLTLLSSDLAPAALAPRLAAALRVTGGTPAVFVLEGVLMYLPPALGGALIDAIGALAPPGSRIVLSYLTSDPPAPAFVRGLVARAGEPFRAAHRPDEIAELLGHGGFRVDADLDDAGLLDRFGLAPRRPPPRLLWERVLVARREGGSAPSAHRSPSAAAT